MGRRRRRSVALLGAAALLAAAAAAAAGCSEARARRVLVHFWREEGCEVYPFEREVPDGRPLEVVRATLEALLAGPTEEEAEAGFRSAIPDTLEVLRHRMRNVVFGHDPPHTGKRVEIQSLEAGPDRILRVSFSPEINAYDRGATRVCAIVRQLQETVRQFPEWKGVHIAVDGKTEGVLQP